MFPTDVKDSSVDKDVAGASTYLDILDQGVAKDFGVGTKAQILIEVTKEATTKHDLTLALESSDASDYGSGVVETALGVIPSAKLVIGTRLVHNIGPGQVVKRHNRIGATSNAALAGLKLTCRIVPSVKNDWALPSGFSIEKA